MNELEFKHHLKDLAEGHHHPEEHDWDGANPARKSGAKKPAAKSPAPRKTARKKGSR